MQDEKPPPETDTREVLHRVRSGGTAEFAALYDKVAPALAAWAALRVRPSLRVRLDPEDLLQEICFRAMASLASFDPDRASFRRWVFGIANNVLKDALLALGRAKLVRSSSTSTERSDLFARLPAEVTSISRRAARDEAVERFVDGLVHLNGDERRLLLLRGLEELPFAEVGRVLGIDEKAAEKRWSRLVERLRKNPIPFELC